MRGRNERFKPVQGRRLGSLICDTLDTQRSCMWPCAALADCASQCGTSSRSPMWPPCPGPLQRISDDGVHTSRDQGSRLFAPLMSGSGMTRAPILTVRLMQLAQGASSHQRMASVFADHRPMGLSIETHPTLTVVTPEETQCHPSGPSFIRVTRGLSRAVRYLQHRTRARPVQSTAAIYSTAYRIYAPSCPSSPRNLRLHAAR